jgi:Ca2+-binding EF-hand superfamily protein
VYCGIVLLAACHCSTLAQESKPDTGAPASASPMAEAPTTHKVLFLAPARPLILRTEFASGGSADKGWQAALDALFKLADENGDGRLDAAERKRLPSREMFVAFGMAEARRKSTLLISQKDPRTDVTTREDLETYLQKSGIVRFRLRDINAGRRTRTVQQRTSDALLQRIDTDHDGRLSAEELRNAARALRRFDFDGDESVSTAELGGGSGVGTYEEQELLVANEPGAPPTRSRFIALQADAAREQATRVMERYDTPLQSAGEGAAPNAGPNGTAPPGSNPGDGRLTLTELGGDKRFLEKYDANRDGALDASELEMFLERSDAEVVLKVDGTESPLVGIANTNDPEILQAWGVSSNVFRIGVHQATLMVTRGQEQTSDATEAVKPYMQLADRNKNGYIEMEESRYASEINAIYQEADRNKDGKLYPEELAEALAPLILVGRSIHQAFTSEGAFDFFAAVDGSKDGRLSRSEMKELSAVVLKWDRDGDGAVTNQELPFPFTLTIGTGRVVQSGPTERAQMRSTASGPRRSLIGTVGGPKWFEKMDRNEDGELSRREFLGSDADFVRYDQNSDGVVSASEAAAIK